MGRPEATAYDVVIVGARCAGSPLAAMLADRGLRVLVLDKTDPSTETPSTHLVQGSGVRVLQRLGLADQLAALTDPISAVRLALGEVRARCDDLSPFLDTPALNLRRTTLDPILANRARAAGAELRTGVAVTGLVRDDRGRVTGVVTDRGEVRAGLVVGADGVRSTVARLAGAETYLTVPMGRSFLWGYFDGATPPAGTAWFGNIDGTGFLASPTDGGGFLAVVAVSRSEWPDAKRDLDATFAVRIRGWPELGGVLAGAQRIGRWRVMARGEGYFRQSAGPGWTLVGDAGHFKDPTPGQGISDALRQVERLAPAIEAALGRQGDAALADWWRWRDRDAIEMYWLAVQMGEAGPIPTVQQAMLHRLTATEAGIGRFMSVLNHDVAPSRVFTPGMLAVGVADALRSGREPRRHLLAEAGRLMRDQARQTVLSARARRANARVAEPVRS